MRLIDADALDAAFTDLRFSADGTLAHWGDRPDWCLHGSEVEKLIENAPTIGGWISVKDRLPERYERILTYDKYSGVKENWLLQLYPCVSWLYGFNVTHWMPLPEGPEEEKAGCEG